MNSDTRVDAPVTNSNADAALHNAASQTQQLSEEECSCNDRCEVIWKPVRITKKQS